MKTLLFGRNLRCLLATLKEKGSELGLVSYNLIFLIRLYNRSDLNQLGGFQHCLVE